MFLYIDPGTGSMLFTILIGIIGTGIYTLKMFFIKMRFKSRGGKKVVDREKIPFVVFSDDKRYWQIFEPICREMDKRGKDVLYITASPDDAALNCKYSHIKAECIENSNKLFMRLNFLNAGILLSTTPGLDVYQWKRSKDVQYYVHIPHQPNEVVRYRMFGLDYYDAVLLSGEHQARDLRYLEKLRSLPQKELVQVGIPYMDEMVKKLSGEGKVKEHVGTTVLLAPTWGSSGIFSVYGGEIIDALQKTGYHIIIRPHPQSFKSEKEMIERLMKKYPESDRLEWNQDADNFDVLCRSDILISDFSGVLFDFALVYDKPVIYTNYGFKLDLYDAWWLDRPLWTLSALPRIGCELKMENMNAIKQMIDDCLMNPVYETGRSEVRTETWEHYGEGAVRVVDYLIDKYDHLSDDNEKTA